MNYVEKNNNNTNADVYVVNVCSHCIYTVRVKLTLIDLMLTKNVCILSSMIM